MRHENDVTSEFKCKFYKHLGSPNLATIAKFDDIVKIGGCTQLFSAAQRGKIITFAFFRDDDNHLPVLRDNMNPSRAVPRWQSSWGQHGPHMGPVGPRWAPCWSHEPCYQGPTAVYPGVCLLDHSSPRAINIQSCNFRLHPQARTKFAHFT